MLQINLITNKIINDNLIQSFLIAIDNKNKEEIKFLYNEKYKKGTENDIVFEMYSQRELNSERLKFIIENCNSYLNISSSLIKQLMKDNNKGLLEILFKNHLNFFDNELILNLLNHYENQMSITNTELSTLINNDKYKLSSELGEIFDH